MYQRVIKRGLDILLCGAAMLIIWPLFLLIAILIKLDSKGPVYFKQKRVGIHKTHFYIYKFRTMRTDTPKDVPTHLLQDPDAFITRMGKFLRKTSLDELPQLFNVLKGDMSLVGPRPPIPREVIQYNTYQFQRLSVKPGITCYWQISGRNNIDFDEWVELDLKYIKERNLFKDIYIILMTLPVLLGDKNAS